MAFGLSAAIHAVVAAGLARERRDEVDFARGGEPTPVIELAFASPDSTGGPVAEARASEEARERQKPQAEEPVAEMPRTEPQEQPTQEVPVLAPLPQQPVAEALPVAALPIAKTVKPAPLRRKVAKAEKAAAKISRPRGAPSQRSGSGGEAASAGASQLSDYRAAVLARLAQFKAYPNELREAGVSGRVGLAFTITPSGAVAGVRVASSSGQPGLDSAALEMVRRAAPFPPPPAHAAGQHFTPGIVYALH